VARGKQLSIGAIVPFRRYAGTPAPVAKLLRGSHASGQSPSPKPELSFAGNGVTPSLKSLISADVGALLGATAKRRFIVG
jgi:hypothetical protein